MVLGSAMLMLVAGSVSAFAQNKVSGVVTDPSGESLPGVAVMVKGTTTGTVTDIDGKFTINAAQGTQLEISNVGFKTETITVGAEKNLKITLTEDAQFLDEVVVVGYGTVKKKDLTGSVAAVNGETLAARQTTNLSTALQGSLSGVLVERNGSAPGAAASNIRVRGVTTIGNSNPLIIVDGVVTGDIDYVNANDVESVSVLKDASAASIYGAKAAAGVILITTKRGDEAGLSMSYSGEFGLEIPTAEPDMVGVTRYLEMNNELLYNDNPTAGFYQLYSADQVRNWVKYNSVDPNNYPVTDWRGMMMKPFAPRHSHNLTITGGNKVVKSKASISYDDVRALYADRKFNRLMIRTNNDFTVIKDLLYAKLDLNIRTANNHRPNYDPFDDMRKMPAIYAAVWKDGRIAEGKSGANPYGLLLNSGTYDAMSLQVGGKAALELRPVKGLSIQAIVSPFISFTKSKSFHNAAWYTVADNPEQIGGYLEGGGRKYTSNALDEGRNDSSNITTQVLINYNNTFKNAHNLALLAGYESYYAKSESLSAGRDMFELPQYHYLSIGNKDFQSTSGSGTEYSSNSFFGRVSYDYKSKYLIQANVRYDGSSRFARKYRWGLFPSFSAGWAMSEENFMQAAKPWLSFMKLRASWGQLGNERIGDNYFAYMALMNFGSSLMYDSNGEINSMSTAAQRALAVEDITWETTSSTDIGLDMKFFKNRLEANFDYYWKKTDGMLLNIEIPWTMGYSNPKTNAGSMKTRGFDLELSWNDRIGDFSYKITANLSDFQSRIASVNGADIISSGHIQREGEYYNAYYGFVSEGIYQTQDEVDNSAKLNSSVAVGDIRYKDISGPEGVPDGVISSEYDRVVLGNPLPRFQYGGNINLAWKGLDFTVAFQGIGKKDAYLSEAYVKPIRDNYGNIPAILDNNYWSPYNTPAQNAAAKYPRISKTSMTNNYSISNFWLFNGAYFRLKNITLGYTFPERWMQAAKIKSLRVFASASDLFCISNYPKGWDPEMGTSSYPITTSVLMGLSIKF